MNAHTVTTGLLREFGDPKLNAPAWNGLLRAGATEAVFLTWEWQTAWWECFGRGRLLLTVAERDGQVVALAPLFEDGGMIFFIGSGGSDYLDFIGDIADPAVLDALLVTARDAVPDFLGFRFYHVPDESPTGRLLSGAANRLGLTIFDEGELPAPVLDLAGDLAVGRAAAGKDSLVRRERWFQREGKLTVEHATDAAPILPQLDAFFDQHTARWATTPYPSLFNDPVQRRFYVRLTELADRTGWLRFTRVTWNGCPIAFHYGFCHANSFLWYKPSFDPALAKRSPGEVLLRHLILTAVDERARTFDFGLGDEAFKRRFATRVATVRTWGLYPASDQPSGSAPP